MSLVCFPFKEEDVSVVVRNVEYAAQHPRVHAILCVGYSKGETWHAIANARPGIEARTGKRVILLLQKRIGLSLRGGKGDGMNTALLYFAENKEYTRLHFYDADIVSFSGEYLNHVTNLMECVLSCQSLRLFATNALRESHYDDF
jgi:mannosylglycerate synthase